MFDLVMIGSSIFEFWGKPAWTDLKISNQAVRSTTSQHWREADLSQLPLARSYLIYCGSNDLIFGDPDRIPTNLLRIIELLHQHFPKSKVGYFSIIKCPQKADKYKLIDQINASIKAIEFEYFQYFESNDYLNDEPKWYLEDGLHLTEKAYEKLNDKLELPLKQWLNGSVIIE